tara:strand:- start:345 stop:575 length:231 start_codon:yes stop_codon:yes gene_type:complete
MKKMFALIVASSFLFVGCASELENKATALVEKACACGEDAKCKLDAGLSGLKLAKEIAEAEDKGAAEALAKLAECK